MRRRGGFGSVPSTNEMNVIPSVGAMVAQAKQNDYLSFGKKPQGAVDDSGLPPIPAPPMPQEKSEEAELQDFLGKLLSTFGAAFGIGG